MEQNARHENQKVRSVSRK